MLSKKFTLLELLVVVAIIGILLTLLLPSLRKARYAAQLAVCASNLREVGKSYTLYAVDNSRHYPANAKWSDITINGGSVDIRYYLRPSLQTIGHNTMRPISMIMPYWGGSNNSETMENMRLAYTCPMVEQEYTKKHKYDSDGDGSKDAVRFPYGSTHAWVTTYSIWPNYYRSDSTFWQVAEPMRVLGEPWRLGRNRASGQLTDIDREDAWSHIMGSDINTFRNDVGGVNRMMNNHYPIGRKAEIDREWRQNNNPPDGYSGFRWGSNGGTSGWMSLGVAFASNYLFDDGRVTVRKGLSKFNTVHNTEWTGHAIPKVYFQEGK